MTAENTGCVHIAPGHGLEDYELGMKHHLEIFCPVGGDGRYTAEAGEKYQGLYVKEADSEVIADLEEQGRLLLSGTAGAPLRPLLALQDAHHLHRH